MVSSFIYSNSICLIVLLYIERKKINSNFLYRKSCPFKIGKEYEYSYSLNSPELTSDFPVTRKYISSSEAISSNGTHVQIGLLFTCVPTNQSNNLVQHHSSKEPPHKSIGKSILFAHQIAILELLNLHHINRNKYVGSSKIKI